MEKLNKIAEEQNCPVPKIGCRNCTKWDYNNGGDRTSRGESDCLLHKETTDGYQYCEDFEKNF